MNWTEIKEKCPKSYREYSLFTNKSIPKSAKPYVPDFIDLHDRRLYDFFDENDIHIESSITCPGSWDYDIFRPSGGGVHNIADKCNFITRTEAETSAFTKAFEILEQKL